MTKFPKRHTRRWRTTAITRNMWMIPHSIHELMLPLKLPERAKVEEIKDSLLEQENLLSDINHIFENVDAVSKRLQETVEQ